MRKNSYYLYHKSPRFCALQKFFKCSVVDKRSYFVMCLQPHRFCYDLDIKKTDMIAIIMPDIFRLLKGSPVVNPYKAISATQLAIIIGEILLISKQVKAK